MRESIISSRTRSAVFLRMRMSVRIIWRVQSGLWRTRFWSGCHRCSTPYAPAAVGRGIAPEKLLRARHLHGKKRSNQTHKSKSDPDAKQARKSERREAKLSFSGNLPMGGDSVPLRSGPAAARRLPAFESQAFPLR